MSYYASWSAYFINTFNYIIKTGGEVNPYIQELKKIEPVTVFLYKSLENYLNDWTWKLINHFSSVSSASKQVFHVVYQTSSERLQAAATPGFAAVKSLCLVMNSEIFVFDVSLRCILNYIYKKTNVMLCDITWLTSSGGVS